MPILRKDKEEKVVKAVTFVNDARATHYWDADKFLAKEFSEVLQFQDNRPAWDIYLVYGQTAKWEEKAPKPDFWMHKLDEIPKDNFLDPKKLSQEIVKRLSSN